MSEALCGLGHSLPHQILQPPRGDRSLAELQMTLALSGRQIAPVDRGDKDVDTELLLTRTAEATGVTLRVKKLEKLRDQILESLRRQAAEWQVA
jgi:hypothetical protein